jgi:thioredoxin-like negative regulator of GroEL
MVPVLRELAGESAGAFRIVQVDAAADAQLSASFGVMAVPTFVLFRGGERVGQISGFRTKKQMQKWLEECLGGS